MFLICRTCFFLFLVLLIDKKLPVCQSCLGQQDFYSPNVSPKDHRFITVGRMKRHVHLGLGYLSVFGHKFRVTFPLGAKLLLNYV